MRFGIMIEGQEGLSWERWQRIASRVEASGLDSLWRSDHFFSVMGETERDSLETWAALTYVAQATRRIRFGPLVCSMTFRPPALLARMAAAVDQLSGGRLELGLGAGWYEREHTAFGIPFPPLKERMDRLAEGVEVIRRLWGDDHATYQGTYYQLQQATCRPKPRQRKGPPRGSASLVHGGHGKGPPKNPGRATSTLSTPRLRPAPCATRGSAGTGIRTPTPFRAGGFKPPVAAYYTIPAPS